MDFSEKITSCRKNSNLTQKQLAELLGCTPTALNYWEKGKREPNIAMVRKISLALGVSANYLIGLDEYDETKNSPAPEDAEDDEISVEDMREFLSRLGFIAEGRDLSEKDIIFMRDVFDLLGVWFGQ